MRIKKYWYLEWYLQVSRSFYLSTENTYLNNSFNNTRSLKPFSEFVSLNKSVDLTLSIESDNGVSDP